MVAPAEEGWLSRRHGGGGGGVGGRGSRGAVASEEEKGEATGDVVSEGERGRWESGVEDGRCSIGGRESPQWSLPPPCSASGSERG